MKPLRGPETLAFRRGRLPVAALLGAALIAAMQAAIADGHARLGKRGRLLVRASGTEPVIRVMAEGDDEALVAAVVDEIATAVAGAAEGAGEHAGAAAP